MQLYLAEQWRIQKTWKGREGAMYQPRRHVSQMHSGKGGLLLKNSWPIGGGRPTPYESVTVAECLLLHLVCCRVRVRVRIRFSVSLDSGYAHVFFTASRCYCQSPPHNKQLQQQHISQTEMHNYMVARKAAKFRHVLPIQGGSYCLTANIDQTL